MNWFSLAMAALVLAGAAWVAWKLYGGKQTPAVCIHCGRCLVSGACVLREGQAGKKPADNS